MRIIVFCHSLTSDWNHGNAHFLRGIACELLALGHEVTVYEPHDAWSVSNLVSDHGTEPIQRFEAAYPELRPVRYDRENLDLNLALCKADLVLVHEWNEPELVGKIGEHRASHPHYTLFFHDTHHRSASAPEEMARYDLRHYDAVLAFGEVVRAQYLARGWHRRAFTWHEAADLRKFTPARAPSSRGDLVWIGNFGDDERTRELQEFLIEPVRRLGIRAKVYGVRYPESALSLLRSAGIEYGGYLPNWEVPRVFAEHRVTLHIPRGPYTLKLPGIPTIRPFEAMACGIPLVSAPWLDTEGLFVQGSDYLLAHDTNETCRSICLLLDNPERSRAMAASALATITSRHTCAHRVEQLLSIHRTVLADRAAGPTQPKDHKRSVELNSTAVPRWSYTSRRSPASWLR